jgi:hypothetical protein
VYYIRANPYSNATCIGDLFYTKKMVPAMEGDIPKCHPEETFLRPYEIN